MPRGRLVPQWTAIHSFTRALENACCQCGEPIKHGTYRREVWIYTHERYGDEFVVLRYHEWPECPKYLGDWNG